MLRSLNGARNAADFDKLKALQARLESIFTGHHPSEWDFNEAFIEEENVIKKVDAVR